MNQKQKKQVDVHGYALPQDTSMLIGFFKSKENKENYVLAERVKKFADDCKKTHDLEIAKGIAGLNNPITENLDEWTEQECGCVTLKELCLMAIFCLLNIAFYALVIYEIYQII